MPTIVELGRAAKQAHPGAYDDVPDADLGRAFKQAYPGSYDDFMDAPGPAKAPSSVKYVGRGDRPQEEPPAGFIPGGGNYRPPSQLGQMLIPLIAMGGMAGPELGAPLGDLAAAGRQGVLAARSTPPAVNPIGAISALPGLELLGERLGLPKGVAAATDLATTYGPKGIAFAREAGRYLTQKPFGPEFQVTPPAPPRPAPGWTAGPGPSERPMPDIQPITPVIPTRGKQMSLDLTPAARTPGWTAGPGAPGRPVPEFQPIPATELPSGRVPGRPSPKPAPTTTPGPASPAPAPSATPSAPAPQPADTGGVSPIDVPFGQPVVTPPDTLPSADWRFEDARDMARLLHQHGINPADMEETEWQMAAPMLKRNLGVPNARSAQLVHQEWLKLQRGQ